MSNVRGSSTKQGAWNLKMGYKSEDTLLYHRIYVPFVFLYSAFPRSRPAARFLRLAGWPTCGWPVGLHVAGRLAEFILAPITPLRYNYKMGIIEPFPGNITESEETL